MPWFREKIVWIPLYVFIGSFLLFNFKRSGYYLLIFLLLTVGTADIVSNYGFKKNIQRLRPCNEIELFEQINVRVPCGSGYSFTSSHATNHFAIAFFLICTIGRLLKFIRLPLFAWATIIAVSQVYVGVHYPLDIICGGLLGSTIAILGAYIYNYYFSIE